MLARHGIRSFGVCGYDRTLADLPCRGRKRIPAAANTVIVCAFPYYTSLEAGAAPNLARYAMIPDYHIVCGDLLAAACADFTAAYAAFGGAFVWFCDNSPLREKEFAYRAGLGRRGRNQLILHPTYGSYWFIGTIVSNLPSVLLGAPERAEPLGGCADCGACAHHCPQGCLPRLLGSSRCLSEITQQKGELSPADAAAIAASGVVWGCDRCAECCPHNAAVPPTHLTAFFADVVPTVTAENLTQLLQNRPFAYRGKAVLQRNLALCCSLP